jgi:hypothetical protein
MRFAEGCHWASASQQAASTTGTDCSCMKRSTVAETSAGSSCSHRYLQELALLRLYQLCTLHILTYSALMQHQPWSGC